MDAGAAIRRARTDAGLTQAELASRSGTSQATLSAYEHGHKVPSAATLGRILAAAGFRLVAEPASRAVTSPGRARLEELGDTLAQVLELAAELPVRHSPTLRYPRLPAGMGSG
jgi:transcriptional regulator with XRE-family HTH domain